MNAGGEPAGSWGIDATDTTFYGTKGNYGPILSTLRNPVNSPCQQCVGLSNAVGNSQRGSGSISFLC